MTELGSKRNTVTSLTTIRLVACLLSLVAALANAGSADLSWTPSSVDVDGQPIDPGVLTYRLRANDVIEYEGPDLAYVHEYKGRGCYQYYVTSYRNDSNLESAPSNTVEKCTGRKK